MSIRTTGKFLFISMMSRAWRFTLSNALLKSIAHKLTVFPPLMKRSTTWQTVYSMATTHPFFKAELFIIGTNKFANKVN